MNRMLLPGYGRYNKALQEKCSRSLCARVGVSGATETKWSTKRRIMNLKMLYILLPGISSTIKKRSLTLETQDHQRNRYYGRHLRLTPTRSTSIHCQVSTHRSRTGDHCSRLMRKCGGMAEENHCPYSLAGTCRSQSCSIGYSTRQPLWFGKDYFGRRLLKCH